MAAQVCASAKFQKVFNVWQKPGHDAGQEHSCAPMPVVSNGQVFAVLHAVEKTFLVAEPIQLIALASPEAYYLVAPPRYRSGPPLQCAKWKVAVTANESTGKSAKGTPAGSEVISAS